MHIDLIPTGGLCNRMRAIASAYKIACSIDSKLYVIWNKYDGLNADFYELFLPFKSNNIKIVESNKWLYNINHRKDYLKRALPLRLKYNKIYYQPIEEDNILEKLNSKDNKKNLIISGSSLCNEYELSNLFTPTNEIKEKIQNTITSFNNNTIGIHIRRTDNSESIRVSTTEAFQRKINEELKKEPTTLFYLATDDNCIKKEFLKKYGEHIITTIFNTNRDCLEGMQFAVYDLYCLSSTKKIIGSYFSSYTQIAAKIGGIDIEYARK